MIYNTERAGRSAYYERPAKERKRAKESLRKMKICLNCTKEKCTGTCELMRRKSRVIGSTIAARVQEHYTT